VSPFCTELTTITQDLLDQEGISFLEAIAMLEDEYQPDQYTWASYGQYDLNMLKKQCKLRNVPYPMGSHHINVKEYFSEVKGLTQKVGMNGALDILKIPLEGTHHRGVDDAKNIDKYCMGVF
jgi:inhibitor of KinA sporulation pathway (predicted exonuclease)